MNAHFKPFAAIGYEYNKVAVQSGSARLGAEVQFSIPQFGDFFHDMVFHIVLGSVTALNADYYVNSAANPASGQELLAYVDYLGQRLVQRVRMSVNGNPLDEYDSDVENFHQKFFVTPNKTVGWDRNVAQEVPWKGFAEVNRDPASGRHGRGAGVREVKYFVDGPQTPKPVQPEIELWVPLLFWFNRDPRLAIPSVSIPYGQRFIDLTLASAADILQHVHAFDPALDSPGTNPVPVPDVETCELYINNIFVNPEIHDIFIKRIGFSLIRVHRRQTIRVNKQTDNLLLNQLKWPIETIYVGLRPVENITLTNSKLRDSWYIYAQTQTKTVDLCSLQNGYSFADSIPSSAITADQYTDAFRSFTGLGLDFANALGVAGTTVLTVNQLNAALTSNGFPPLTGLTGTVQPTSSQLLAALPPVNCEASYQICIPTIERLSIEAHGVPLYRDIPAMFFNQYIPWTYGGQHINTPYDCGALMITFNLYPGSYQPSGHVNISRAREFYLNYTSNQVGTEEIPTADLVVVAIAINFLLISDGSAVLRYST